MSSLTDARNARVRRDVEKLRGLPSVHVRVLEVCPASLEGAGLKEEEEADAEEAGSSAAVAPAPAPPQGAADGAPETVVEGTVTVELCVAEDLILTEPLQVELCVGAKYPRELPCVRVPALGLCSGGEDAAAGGEAKAAAGEEADAGAEGGGEKRAVVAAVRKAMQADVLADQRKWSRAYDLAMVTYIVRRHLLRTDQPPWLLREPRLLQDDLTASLRGSEFSPSSVRPAATIQASKLPVHVAQGEDVGGRPFMEDKSVVQDARYSAALGRQYALYCVFDGHAGEQCAAMAAQQFPDMLHQQLEDRASVRSALYHAIVQLEEAVVLTPSGKPRNNGCTAVCVVVDEAGWIFCANVGDSRAVLCREGAPVHLSLDAKASDPNEAARVVLAGSFVSNDRVMGQLAVTRALGDGSLKQLRDGVVLATPEISCVRLQEPRVDEFFVMACDGVYDVMTNEEVVDFVRSYLRNEASELAGAITHAAASLASKDAGISGTFPQRRRGRARSPPTNAAEALVQYVVDERRTTDNASVIVCSFVEPAPRPEASSDHSEASPSPAKSASGSASRAAARATATASNISSAAAASAGSVSAPATATATVTAPTAPASAANAGAAGSSASSNASASAALGFEAEEADVLNYLLDDANFDT